MKAFTNKIFACLAVLCLLAACSSKTPSIPVENLEVETVEEITPAETSVPAEEPVKEAAISSQAQTTLQEKPVVAKKPTTQTSTRTYTAQELMAQLKKWEENLKTFQSDFNQVSSYDGVEINRSKGRLYYDFSKGLLRWEVLDNANELTQAAISNKKEIIILDETLKPVTTLSWKEWQKGQANQALFDIGSYAQLAQNHTVTVSSQDEQQAVLSLTPKNEAEKYTLLITLSKKDFFPQEITIQADDMCTKNELLSVRKNESLSADLFGGFFK